MGVHVMNRIWRSPAFTILGASLALCLAATPVAAGALSLEKVKKLEALYRDRFVIVNLWLRRVDGVDPSGKLAEAWREERPFQTSALLVDPTTLWMPLIDIDERHFRAITVGQGEATAHIHGYFVHAEGWVLKLDEPYAKVKPLAFVAAEEIGAASDLVALAYAHELNGWTLRVWETNWRYASNGKRTWAEIGTSGVLIARATGEAVGYTFDDELTLEGSGYLWRGCDLDKDEVFERSRFETQRALHRERSRWLIPTVRINFRAVEQDASSGTSRFERWEPSFGVDEIAAHEDVPGLAVGPKLVLAHIALDPVYAKRLESIVVRLPSGERSARFVGTYKDYGLVLAEIEGEPLAEYVDLSAAGELPVFKLIVTSAAEHSTGARYEWVELNRITGELQGYRNVREQVLRRFQRHGALLFGHDQPHPIGVAIEVRRKDIDRRQRFQRGAEIDLRLMTLGDVAALVTNAEQFFDPRLRPATLERENDIVWLGVDYQGINFELARTKGVELATRGGALGLIVNRVYAESPAAIAGLRAGDVLLAVRDDSLPEPCELAADSHEDEFARNFGEMIGRVPEEAMSEFMAQMPAPWPGVRNALNRVLTEIGADRDVEVTFLRDGQEQSLQVKLALAPPDYENATRVKVEALGLAVKDLSFEVRAHYRLGPASPGVVVAEVEIGSKASTARIFNYEVISEINGRPVKSAKQFEEEVKGLLDAASNDPGSVLDFKVERMGVSRIARLPLE